jgi:hypothetical protein
MWKERKEMKEEQVKKKNDIEEKEENGEIGRERERSRSG